MKNGIVSLITATLGILSTVPAAATNLPGSVTVTPGFGYYFFADKRHLKNAGIGDIALAYNVDNRWAVEGFYGAMNPKLNDRVAGDPVRAHANLFLLNGLYRFYKHAMFEPYLSGGLGALYISHSRTEANTLANINVGIGMQVFFDRYIALRGEARYLYTPSGGYSDAMVNFGVSILLGGETPTEVDQYKGMAKQGDI